VDRVSASPDGRGPREDEHRDDEHRDDEHRDDEHRDDEHRDEADRPAPLQLREMWELLDPVPSGLAARIGFALEVEEITAADLDLELMRLVEEQTAAVGSRGDQVRTITFGSDSMTVMLALSDVDGGYRVDGWVAPGGRRRLEVRTAAGSNDLQCDETGRFTVPLVPRGHFQLVLEGDDETPAVKTGARRAVVTPALTL